MDATTRNTEWWRPALAIVAGIAVWQASAHVASDLGAMLVGHAREPAGMPIAVYGVVKALFVAVGLALTVRLARIRLRDIGLGKGTPIHEILIGAGIAGLWALVQLCVLIPLTGGADRHDIVVAHVLMGETPRKLFGIIVAGWTAGGFAEELFYRGYLIHLGETAATRRGVVTALLLVATTVYFGLGHGYQGVVGVVDVSMSGLIFGITYVWRRGLIAATVAHGLYDTLLTIGILFFY